MLAQMGQMMQIRQAQQEYDSQNALRDAFSQGTDINDPAAFKRIAAINPKLAFDLRGKDLEQRQKGVETGIKINEVLGSALGGLVQNPTLDYARNTFSHLVSTGVLPPDKAAAMLAKLEAEPGRIKEYATLGVNAAITAQAKMQDQTSRRNTDVSSGASYQQAETARQRLKMDQEGTWSNVIVGRRVLQQNSRTGEFREAQDPYDNKSGTVTIGPITNLPDTSTNGGVVTGGGGGPTAPNTLAAPSVNALRNPPVVATTPVPKTRPPVTNPLMVEEKPVWNEKAGVFMYPPTAENPQGKVVETPALQEAVQKRAANQALKVAGFDPKTGSNEISQLIEKSTSGLGANALSKIASSVGWGTEGAQAIAKLETRANQLTLDLAPNGSLGAGFSNDDRIFMLSKLGDVANPNKPVSVRLAAWEDVMERAARTAGVPYPKSAKSTGDITIDPAIAEALKRYPAKK
jgi:hypothetical protein